MKSRDRCAKDLAQELGLNDAVRLLDRSKKKRRAMRR
jgi:hypothetical protein